MMKKISFISGVTVGAIAAAVMVAKETKLRNKIKNWID